MFTPRGFLCKRAQNGEIREDIQENEELAKRSPPRQGQFFYATVSKGTGTIFHPLENKGLEVSAAVFSEASSHQENTRRASRKTLPGIATMDDLLGIYRERIKTRPKVSERTRELNFETCVYIEKTSPGFTALKPASATRAAIEECKTHALTICSLTAPTCRFSVPPPLKYCRDHYGSPD